MKAGSRGSTDTRERFGMRRALVVAQVALSLVLVVGAVLFVRSLRNLMTLDAGFQQDGVLVVNLDLRRAGVAEERRRALYADITARLGALPGVMSAAQAGIVPVSGSGWNNNIVIDGKKHPRGPGPHLRSAGARPTRVLCPWGVEGGDQPAAGRPAADHRVLARRGERFLGPDHAPVQPGRRPGLQPP